MIKSDKELAISKKLLLDLRSTKTVKQKGFNPLAVKKIGAEVESFALGVEADIQEYESIKKGIIHESYFHIQNLGLLLIALRIKNNITQTELAHRLEVSPSQVSRDENNDYHGVSLTTVVKILNALGEKVDVVLKS